LSAELIKMQTAFLAILPTG